MNIINVDYNWAYILWEAEILPIEEPIIPEYLPD